MYFRQRYSSLTLPDALANKIDPGTYVIQFYLRTATNAATRTVNIRFGDGIVTTSAISATYSLITLIGTFTSSSIVVDLDFYGGNTFYTYGWKVVTYENYLNTTATNFITIGNNASNINIRNSLLVNGDTTLFDIH